MPLPDFLMDYDPREVRLAKHFADLYEYLVSEGVPEDRLPGPWHMLSRVVKCVDPDLMQEWLDAYVRVEAEEYDENEVEEDAPSFAPRPMPKRRPDYLRALEDQVEDDEQEKDREDGS